jgi:hypothetical protein
VRFASLLACAAWVVSLAGFLEYEPAGIHTIQDSMTIILSESDAESDFDNRIPPGSEAPDHPAGAVVSLLDGSAIPSLFRPSLLRNGIGRLLPPVSQLVATAVLRP